jgi:hypothetical protein
MVIVRSSFSIVGHSLLRHVVILVIGRASFSQDMRFRDQERYTHYRCSLRLVDTEPLVVFVVALGRLDNSTRLS